MAAFTVKIDGREYTFKSEDDFARAHAAMQRVGQPPEKNGKRGASEREHPRSFNLMQATQDFLQELVSHGEGVHSNAVAQALKCEPRGIGRRLLEMDTLFKALGFKREKVYDNSKRIAEGGRMYFPKDDAAAALEAVKRRAGSG